MNQKQMIESLKKECEKSPTLNAIMHMLALRERARSSLTITGLSQRMTEEGFKYSSSEYESALRAMADAGVGIMDIWPNGRPRGLKNIPFTLKSLGLAVCGKSDLKRFKAKAHFTHVLHQVPASSPPPLFHKMPLVITALINNKPLNISVPDTFTRDDLEDLIDRFWLDREGRLKEGAQK